MSEEARSTSPVAERSFTREIDRSDLDSLIEKEWLVTNGLGGYASGTIAGASTRRYHGLLIAAHPAPLGRVMLLNHLGEQFQLDDRSSYSFGLVEQAKRSLEKSGLTIFRNFRLELGLPVWEYDINGHRIEKRVYMPYRQNTVHVNYRLVSGGGPVQLKLRVSVHFRGHDDHVSLNNPEPYVLTASGRRYELSARGRDFPSLNMTVHGNSAALTLDEKELPDVLYRIEQGRGYDNIGSMWSPGYVQAWLSPSEEVTLIASTESWGRILALSPQAALAAERERRHRMLEAALPSAREGMAGELVLAADQFIIEPVGRVQDSARAEASGEKARTIIAGYHWFTDWGRDTMISLEGLTLVTGRHTDAMYILRNFISHVRDGLIPNFFPDRSTEGVYHTADATLWYFHALSRYMDVTGDRGLMKSHLSVLKDIVACHQRGTRFGISVDPNDGLLREGAEGYQLTWMDAKVGDWVVTPRRGKPVEINALWYNALRLLEGWIKEVGEDPQPIRSAADLVYSSFNSRFWCESEQGLYDVVDGENGDDPACRPNQIFSISLPHAVLSPEKMPFVLETVQSKLLTPFGLRTLAPDEPDFKSRYDGDLRSRDAAYHQGTVWPWLIGPFIDAWLRVHPDRAAEGIQLLSGFNSHLSEACIGTIAEIFDANEPYKARGCAAQAWSVAEVLRALTLLADR